MERSLPHTFRDIANDHILVRSSDRNYRRLQMNDKADDIDENKLQIVSHKVVDKVHDEVDCPLGVPNCCRESMNYRRFGVDTSMLRYISSCIEIRARRSRCPSKPKTTLRDTGRRPLPPALSPRRPLLTQGDIDGHPRTRTFA